MLWSCSNRIAADDVPKASSCYTNMVYIAILFFTVYVAEFIALAIAILSIIFN